MTANILLWDPKHGHNLGGAVRACATLGGDQVMWVGSRIDGDLVGARGKRRIPREERLPEYSHILRGRVSASAAFEHATAAGLTPVAVELVAGAQKLDSYVHPEKALYVFGPEDGSLSGLVKSQCHQFVEIPTVAGRCVNLAAAVYLVLWDRRVKTALVPSLDLIASIVHDAWEQVRAEQGKLDGDDRQGLYWDLPYEEKLVDLEVAKAVLRALGRQL